MLQSANPALARYGKPIERARAERAGRGQIAGVALLAVLYGIVLCMSVGLFRTSSPGANDTARRLIGFVNVLVLPLLVLAAVVGIRKNRLAGAPSRAMIRVLTAPLWLSLMLSLLTVPIGMGQANAAGQGAESAGVGIAPTFLLAPWGFMLAYGLSLVIIGALFGFPFPLRTEASAQPNTMGLG